MREQFMTQQAMMQQNQFATGQPMMNPGQNPFMTNVQPQMQPNPYQQNQFQSFN